MKLGKIGNQEVVLTEQESDIYRKLEKSNDTDGMFRIGYVIGQERLAKEQLDNLKS